MKKQEYSAPVIRCRQIHTANCFMLRASMGEDSPPIEQAETGGAGPVVDDPSAGVGEAWGDAKHVFDSLWD